MSRYHFPELTWRKVWKAVDFEALGAFLLSNSTKGSTIAVEATGSGFAYLAVNFLMVAAHRDHVHLQSRNDVPSGWVFESGAEVSLGFHPTQGDSETRPRAFTHDAKPVLESECRSLLPGSMCWAALDESDDSVLINGNRPALISLAQACLDLADPRSRSGVEVVFSPGKQLLDESLQLVLRRV